MSYDEGLAQRVRETVDERENTSEKRMFGGLAFLVSGNMCFGIVGAELMVRVGAERYPEALREPHAREMDFNGRPMKGFVYVSAEGVAEDADLEAWVARGLEFASSLPAKQSRRAVSGGRRGTPVRRSGSLPESS